MESVSSAFNALRLYCENENFRGWDPYDGLNSKIFRFFQMHRSRFLRLAWIQFFKRSHINFRRLMLVPKGYNPKGLGLFLSAYCNYYKISKEREALNSIISLADKLLEVHTKGYKGYCWGYDFDWQSRLEFMPKHTPTIVATSFVSNGLLDAYECTGDNRYLEAAESSCRFILYDLNRTERPGGFIFSYSPLDRMRVYNASLLGSRLLSRVYSFNHNQELLEAAEKSVRACSLVQQSDGSWLFGEDPIQNWVDSFHTGFKLESIALYAKYSGDHSFDDVIERGLKFYLENFFLEDGTPKYYNKKTYPIDIHCPGQFLATLYKLNALPKNELIAGKVTEWTIRNMKDPDKNFFYYQINPGRIARIPYMRWGQAWIFYGMSYYLLYFSEKNTDYGKNP